jgi:7-cyano-7-deazaguanine synthase in queuosine biosynthesis
VKQAAVLYSGGADSTAAVVLVAEKHDRLHLVTYRHSGLRQVDNSAYNLPALRNKFDADKFVHPVFVSEN